MPRFAPLYFLMACANSALANDITGTVCLGKNLALPYEEHTDRLHLRIDDSPNIYFAYPYSGPRVIAQNLDLYKDHLVKVYFDGQVAQSWKLNFSELKTNSVLVWRAPGAWRMEPNEASLCQ